MKKRFSLIKTFSSATSFFRFLLFVILLSFTLPNVLNLLIFFIPLIFFALPNDFAPLLIFYFTLNSCFIVIVFFDFSHWAHFPAINFKFNFSMFKENFFNYYSRKLLIVVFPFFFLIYLSHFDFELMEIVVTEYQFF